MDIPSPPSSEETESILTTYQWMTISRIFERVQLKLSDLAILTLLRHPTSFYHQLLHVPMTHLLNGIILEQAKAYQIYLQKLFVDYLMSGKADQAEDTPGAEDREKLEKARQEMLTLSQSFDAYEVERENLIAVSQKGLITWIVSFKEAVASVKQAHDAAYPASQLSHEGWYNLFVEAEDFTFTPSALARFEKDSGHILSEAEKTWITAALTQAIDPLIPPFTDWLETYTAKVDAMRTQLMTYRKQFYDEIIHVQEIISFMSALKLDAKMVEKNREAIRFDAHIGEKGK